MWLSGNLECLRCGGSGVWLKWDVILVVEQRWGVVGMQGSHGEDGGVV